MKPAKVSSRPDMVSAAVSARAQGSPVEAEDARTEYSTSWANPDGTVTVRDSFGKVRFRDAKGAWASVDLNFKTGTDGTLVAATPDGLRLASGSKDANGQVNAGAALTGGDLVTAAPGKDRQVVFGWGKGVGAPKTAGNMVTFPAASSGGSGASGVDVRVASTRDGFESFFDIKDAATLNSLVLGDGPAKGRVGVVFPVKTKGLTATVEKDGSVSFTDAKGKVHSKLAPPRAWDARIDPKSGLPTAETPARLDVTQQGKGKATVTVSVDAAWAKNPARSFPVTIDPTYAAGANIAPSFDTRVQTDGGTLDYSNDAELRVGTFNGGSTVARSFIMFPTAAVQGKQVTTASLSLYENWSWSCTASGMTLSTSGAPSAATRWGNQPTIYSAFTTASFAKGASSACPAGRVSLNMLPLVTSAQTNKWTQMAVALKAANEADSNGWKRFGSSESANPPYVTWTYNRAPNQAAAPTFLASGTYGNIGYVAGGKVTFTTKATDADGSQVKALVEVHNSTTVSASSKVASCTTPLGASAASLSCVNNADMPNGGTYYVRALTTDEKGLSAGSWSSWTTIKRAATAPAAPSISCPGYANGSWAATGPSADLVCTVSVSGSGTLAATTLNLYVDGATTPTKTVAVNQAATSTTVTVAKADGGHSVRAVAIGGSNLSATTTSSFGWGKASMLSPVNRSSTSGKVQVTARGAATNVKPFALVQTRVAGLGDTGWVNSTPIPVTTASGVATANGVLDTAPITKDGNGTDLPERTPVTFEVQVCFEFTVGAQQCTFVQSPNTITRLPHAFGGGYPTTDAGPGQLAQVTGELSLSGPAVSVPGLSGDLSISASHLSFAGDGTLTGWPKDLPNTVFGPGWTGSLDGPDAGAASMQIIDNTGIDGTMILSDEEGSVLVFRQPGGTRTFVKAGVYTAATQDTIDSDVKLEVTTGGAQVKVTESDGTLTTYTPVKAATVSPMSFAPASVAEPGAAGTTTYTRDSTGRTTRITSGLPDGFTAADCPSTGLGKAGCRYLDISYGASNTGTDAAPGDRAGQVKQVSSVLWNPATSAMESTPMATFGYDGSGRLVKHTDTRTGLTTTYSWIGTTTRLASVTPPGQAAYRFTYDSAGKLVKTTRDGATSGAAAVTLGTYFYNVATSSTAIPQLTAEAVGKWSQATPPAADGLFAVFGQDHPMTATSNDAVTDADWKYADLSWVDAQNYVVNTGKYGAGKWLLTSTDYDAKGNTVRELDAGAIASLQAMPGTVDQATADAYSTETEYNDDIKDTTGAVIAPAGTFVTDTHTPGTTVTMPDGTVLTGARRTVHTDYDQGAPNNGVNPATSTRYNLPTTVTTTVTGSTVELGKTVNTYAPVVAGDGDGWALGSPTKVTTNGVTKTTRFDTSGRVIETRDPSATSSASPQATQTIYYTAGTNSADPACGGSAQAAAWSGSVCVIKPGAAPSAGPVLPTRRSTYDKWLNTATLTETAGATARTTTTKYDTAGRAYWSNTTATTGTARAATFTKYSPSTGEVLYTGVANTAGTDATTVRSSTSYDLWGRKTGYTNDQGETTTTTYDATGQVGSVTDPKGTTTYTYDGVDAAGRQENRGLATKITISRPGSGGALSYTGAHDENGTLVRQNLPGKVTQITDTNELKDPTGLSYTGQITPVTASTDPDTGETTWTPGTPTTGVWLAWTMDRDGLGRIVREYTGNGAGFDGDPGVPAGQDTYNLPMGNARAYDRQYTYSARGQLTKAVDRTVAVPAGPLTPDSTPADTTGMWCQVRTYGFNTDGARTSWAVQDHSDGDCDATPTGSTTISNPIDSANRPTTGATINGTASTGSYTYDGLGRQTSIPAPDTPNYSPQVQLGYYVDDLPRSVTVPQTAVTSTFDLDSQGRRSTETTTGGWEDGNTTQRHYGDDSDNPAWSITTPKGGTPETTRYTDSLSGELGAMITSTGDATIPLTDPHDNNVTSITIPAGVSTDTASNGISGWSSYSEYGSTESIAPGGHVGPLRYGWLGAKQRETPLAAAGLTLMGVRYYNWTTGAFTSPDPVAGGNDTTYGYPTDPINNSDPTGLYGGNLWGGANAKEKQRCVRHPRECALNRRTSNWAFQVANSKFPRKANTDKREALRHMIWQAYLTWALGSGSAKAWGDAHEWKSSDPRDSRRDQRNNVSGRQLGQGLRNKYARVPWNEDNARRAAINWALGRIKAGQYARY